MNTRAATRLLAALAAAGLGLAGLGVPAGWAAPDAPNGGSSGTEVLVRYRPGTSMAEMATFERDERAVHSGDVYGLGVRVLRAANAASAARLADAARHNPRVEYAEPNGGGRGTMVPNDPYWSSQWGPAKVRVTTTWDTTVGAPGTVIAVLDSGVNAAHADLIGRTVAGWDFVNNDADPTDDQGHGTSVAGVAAATGGNALGVAGVCWSCAIMPVKVLDASNWATWANVSSGITWATDHGARVISISIIGSSGSTTLANAVQYAHDRGVVVVAAAGNTGDTTVGYPAAYDSVLSVAGSDSNDGRYSWSTYGSWVDVAAPGCNQATTMSGGYANFCGTSSATPIVSGLAALLLSANPTATNTAVENALTGTSVSVGSWVRFGRVDAAAALSALGGTAPVSSPPPPATTEPTTTTTAFSGSLTAKAPVKTFRLSTGAGPLDAVLTFSKASTLNLAVVDGTGTTVVSTSGPSGFAVHIVVPAGASTLAVSGSTRASFTLTATATTP